MDFRKYSNPFYNVSIHGAIAMLHAAPMSAKLATMDNADKMLHPDTRYFVQLLLEVKLYGFKVINNQITST